MRYLKWIGVAVGGVIAYLVYVKLMKKPDADASSESKLEGRQPGFVDNLLGKVGGVFGVGKEQIATPPIRAAYGQVGIPVVGNDAYVATTADTRIPSFLQGATGGVADDKMTGLAPPPVMAGTAIAYPASVKAPTRSYVTLGTRKTKSLAFIRM